MSLGANLSGHNLEFFSAGSPQALWFLLAQIRTPYSIKGFYHDGKKHVVWINSERPLDKKKIMELAQAKDKVIVKNRVKKSRGAK